MPRALCHDTHRLRIERAREGGRQRKPGGCGRVHSLSARQTHEPCVGWLRLAGQPAGGGSPHYSHGGDRHRAAPGGTAAPRTAADDAAKRDASDGGGVDSKAGRASRSVGERSRTRPRGAGRLRPRGTCSGRGCSYGHGQWRCRESSSRRESYATCQAGGLAPQRPSRAIRKNSRCQVFRVTAAHSMHPRVATRSVAFA